MDIKSADELKVLLDNDQYDFRFTCGYNKPISAMTISALVKTVWLPYFPGYKSHGSISRTPFLRQKYQISKLFRV